MSTSYDLTETKQRIVELEETIADLLAAAKALLGLIERMPNASAILSPYTTGGTITKQTRAAIAAAEGQWAK